MNERRRPGEGVEQVLDAGSYGLPGRSPTSRSGGRVQCAGQVEEMGSLGLVELQRAGERFEHGV
jgi:hypothetical protein